MEQDKNSSHSNKSSSQLRDQINVQEYTTHGFKEPQQLQDDENDFSAQDLDSKLICDQKISTQKKGKQSERSSIQTNRNEQILQFKITQLQKICSTLTSANEKLLDKIQELQQQNDLFKNRILLLEQQVQRVQNQQSQYQQSREENSLADERLNQSIESKDFVNQDSQLVFQNQVVDIESMIKDYREELKKSQEINKTCRQKYQKSINQIQNQLEQTRNRLAQTQAINKQIQQELLDLSQKNQSLETEIESIIASNIENAYYEDLQSKRRTQSRSSQYQTPVQERRFNLRGNRHYNNYLDEEDYSQINPFDSSVQAELQKLIQKLVKELQYERSLKKKINQEMKRIQKDLLQSEKQIMLKNKKIYLLEMDLLKGEKNHLFNSTVNNSHSNQVARKEDKQKYSPIQKDHVGSRIKQKFPVPNQKFFHHGQSQKIKLNTSHKSTSNLIQTQNGQKQKMQKSRQYIRGNSPTVTPNTGKLLQSFSLLQLLNEPRITLTIGQKLFICLKLVGLYDKKVNQERNFKLLMLQNVIITNFNRINLRLIKIRIQENSQEERKTQKWNRRKQSSDSVSDGPQKVIWNLGFLLNSLLVDAASQEQDFGHSNVQNQILGQIQHILDNNNLNKEILSRLQSLFEVAYSQRSKKQ